MARRIRWLLAFFLRAEPRGAAPGGWALALDAVVAVGTAVGAVLEMARQRHPGTATVTVSGSPAAVQHAIQAGLPLIRLGHPLLTVAPAHASPLMLTAAALTALPLAGRRLYPVTAWLVVMAAIMVIYGTSAPPVSFVPPVSLGTAVYAAYSAIAFSRYRNTAIAVVSVTTIVASAVLGKQLPRFPGWLTAVFGILPAAVAGLGIRELRHRLADSTARLRRAAAEARAATRAALAAERSRIAAELHDVVTHNVSVMIVQAGAARKILSSSPADAEDALLAVEATGREAMTELRNLLGLLSPRADGATAVTDPVAFTPQPGLGELGTLIGRVSAAGLPVELRVTGVPRPVPPGTDLAAYRVVQEGLTNVLRHAGQATTAVAIDWRQDLVITVTDDGGLEPGAAARGADWTRADGTPGRGLLGLRERLALYGGTLAAGPQPGGGWQLRAVMPAPERSTP